MWIKPTDALNYNFIGITTLHVTASLSAHHQEFLAVHRRWYTLCSCGLLLPGVEWNCRSILLLVANGHHKSSKSPKIHCCQTGKRYIYIYKNTKGMLSKTTTAIWYNKVCRDGQLTHNYITIKVNDSHLLELFRHKMYQSLRVAKNSWWWVDRLPETCRVVIRIKLEFTASDSFIHKESVTMHGHSML